MFNFFNHKPDETKDKTIASITYLVKTNDKQAFIDVQLVDYENESLEALCSLLDILGSDAFYVDTITMISDSLKKEGREDVLANLTSKLDNVLRKKLIDSAVKRLANEPYIKPSEMFR